MNKNEPLVSILMNCYNCEKYLNESLESVLSQSYQNWELVFWDNKSLDNSEKIFKTYSDKRLKYFSSKNHTDLGGARSQAYKYLKGDLIAILDADDIWFKNKLEEQVCFFNDESIGIVISDTLFFNNHKERALYGDQFPSEGFVTERLIKSYNVSLETVVLRKSFIDQLDYAFDPDFSYIADFDLVIRLSEIAKLKICKKVLAKWRVHSDSDSWKSFVTFPLEREKWIKKQIKRDKFFKKKYNSAIFLLHKKNNLIIAIDSIIKRRRLNAIKILFRTNILDLKGIIVLLSCLFPFSDTIYKYAINRRMRRLLR